MSETKATIEASKSEIREMINITAVGYHEKLYCKVSDGRVRFLAGTPGASVVAYTDFIEREIEKIEGDDAEAVIPVPELMDHIDIAGEGTSGNVELGFVSSNDDGLAEQLRISTAGSHSFEAGITLAASESAMESVPADLPAMFNADDVLMNQKDDRPVNTHIDTFAESLEKVIDVIDLREELDYYPVVVKDGEFMLEVGSKNSNYVETTLQGEVEGSDVDNLYGSGFEEVVGAMDGSVSLHLEQDSPLLILNEMSYGTARHVLGAAT